jgi:site-specific recombinase XerD
MTAPSAPTFAQLIQDFFCRHLINQRDVSECTIASYRDTIRLFLNYLEGQLGKQPSTVSLSDLNTDNIEAFLKHLERQRKNSIRTRNSRFAALRSFLKYAAARVPTFPPTAQQVLAIPMKRFDRPLLGFLSQSEMQAILDAPDESKWAGRRDRAMFTMLYNTGARVSELAALKVDDVSLNRSVSVRIHGKGRKERIIPLWKDTAKRLKIWKKEIDTDGQSPLLPNASGGFLTRSGVEYRLKRAVAHAVMQCGSLQEKAVSPHTIRHTTAMHLLQAGVDITLIALWLGHESTVTTHMYVEADLAMKERALNRLDKPKSGRSRYRPSDSLLKFLERL